MNAVVCQDLSKRYALRQAGYRTMRDGVASLFARLRRRERADQKKEFWALREIGLDIPQGEALGVIGPNGSGKSTLLKIIAGVTRPTRGRVEVHGRVGALIEVGTGFHPELTGRENIFLYGAILGLSRQEIRRKFDQIVGFAELEPFLETPIKRYSSGMRVRLGFAVAAHLDPQILLVDEVLSVGDVAYQHKCIRYIRTLQEAGTTIIFVSHELPTVERICKRVVWFDAGRIREAGPSGEVVHRYLESVERAFLTEARRTLSASGALAIEQVSVTDGQDAVRFDFAPGDALTVNLHYRTGAQAVRVVVVLKIIDDQWSTLLVARSNDDGDGLVLQGRGVLRCAFPPLPLASKMYEVWAQVLRLPDYREEIPWQVVGVFSVAGPRFVATSHPFEVPEWESPVLEVPSRWSVAAPDPAGVADG